MHGCTIAPSGFDADTASAWPSCNGGSGDTVGLHAAGGKLAALNVLVEESVVAGWCAGVQFSAEPDPLPRLRRHATRARTPGR